ncbi:MAG: DUF2065 domain-containing protein [Hydrogenophilaceae bacterium]|jgi:hypothetical protein|nr:DUF2065 domain-containing protein [Hydrogenophilaceae bacterium]
MTAADLMLAIALLLLMEGLLPFAAPALWRDAFRRAIELTDGQLRFLGAVSMLGGLLLLLLML